LRMALGRGGERKTTIHSRANPWGIGRGKKGRNPLHTLRPPVGEPRGGLRWRPKRRKEKGTEPLPPFLPKIDKKREREA